MALSTAFFLALVLPFTGWNFAFTLQSGLDLIVLVALKIAEFYTSAALLKTVSAYELKAWLSLNVIVSYLVDLARGTETFFWAFLPCAATLVAGIGLAAFGEKREKLLRYILLSLIYIASKFLYGLQMNVLEGTSPVCVLLLVMLGVALLQLPFVKFKTFFRKKGLALGALTRIPNAAGLWTEAIAAQQNLLLYSLVQPMQLAILFATALIRREKMEKLRLAGSIVTLVALSGKHILLNGAPLRIKGVCRHEDHPQYGCALPFAAMAYDLALIRDLGANSVRTAHYPNDEVFLDLCDELGILVWEENHARGLSLEQMQNPNFERQALGVTREMVTQHYNHPSIYIWGILNECASDSAYGKTCYQEQFACIRALDRSRPCSFASCKFKTDICFGLPEVVSYNIYPKWYHDMPAKEYLADLYDWVQRETEGAGKPFLVTEIGAGGLYGYRSPYATKWSEEFQAKTLREQLEAVLSFEDCAGVYTWQFCDTRISEEWWGGRPRTMNNKGIVDEYRRPKLCYEVVKETFHKF